MAIIINIILPLLICLDLSDTFLSKLGAPLSSVPHSKISKS